MGGIKTDVDGQTNIRGLFACGEVACTGIHGANRLASNSLLEGLVFGRKIARKIELNDKKPNLTDINFETTYTSNRETENTLKHMKEGIRGTMTKYVGILRNEQGLMKAADIISKIHERYSSLTGFSLIKLEVVNMLTVARLVIESAIERKESRGAHYRSDFNKTDDVNWKRNIIKVLDGGMR